MPSVVTMTTITMTLEDHYHDYCIVMTNPITTTIISDTWQPPPHPNNCLMVPLTCTLTHVSCHMFSSAHNMVWLQPLSLLDQYHIWSGHIHFPYWTNTIYGQVTPMSHTGLIPYLGLFTAVLNGLVHVHVFMLLPLICCKCK